MWQSGRLSDIKTLSRCRFGLLPLPRSIKIREQRTSIKIREQRTFLYFARGQYSWCATGVSHTIPLQMLGTSINGMAHAARLELMSVTYGDYIKVKGKIYTEAPSRNPLKGFRMPPIGFRR